MTTSLEIDEKALGALVGPFFTFDSILEWQNLTAEELKEKVLLYEIIELPTSDGVRVFPTWQFNPDGSVNENILKVARILSSGADAWTVCAWLAFSLDEKIVGYKKHTYDDLLRNKNVEDIVLAAQLDTDRWKF